ncbi:MAG: DUF1566 domain-containing protein [Balneolaceae bacterium]
MGTIILQLGKLSAIKYIFIALPFAFLSTSEISFTNITDSIFPGHQQEYQIGERGPAGGTIFHDKGSYSNGWRYLEVAPSHQGDTKWGCNGLSISTGTDVGSGKSNTQQIVSNCDDYSTAAEITENLRLGGNTDWYLPSREELNLIYRNLHAKREGPMMDTRYWSSSQYNENEAWAQFFGDGRKIQASTDLTFRVHAIRSF